MERHLDVCFKRVLWRSTWFGRQWLSSSIQFHSPFLCPLCVSSTPPKRPEYFYRCMEWPFDQNGAKSFAQSVVGNGNCTECSRCFIKHRGMIVNIKSIYKIQCMFCLVCFFFFFIQDQDKISTYRCYILCSSLLNSTLKLNVSDCNIYVLNCP